MSGILGKPKAAPAPEPLPAPEPPAPAPNRTDTEVATAAENQRKRFFAKSGGRARTLLTSSDGAAGGSRAVQLLGGAGRV